MIGETGEIFQVPLPQGEGIAQPALLKESKEHKGS